MRSINEFLNRIITGDCVTVMQEMPPESVDLIATDPPYLVGYASRDGRSLANDRTGEWVLPAFREMYRVLKPNRLCLSFYGWNRVDRFFASWKAAGFRAVGHLVWIKDYASNQGLVRYCHESAYLLAKGRPDKPRIILRDVLTGWQYTGNTRHPTEKPVSVFSPVIRAFSAAGEIVLDPFIGSGTTAVASRELGRRYIGIELDPTYARLANERLTREGAL
jgi:adenine-specific DNA-methyltransferase